MKIIKTNIPGLIIIKPKVYKDRRGFFLETYKNNKYKKLINQNNFVQDNHSFSKKNVLRGIHFQWKKPQAQLIYLIYGRIFIAFIDFRLNSKTYLQKFETILNAKDNLQIFMPAGVGSGFYTLSNEVHKIYKVTRYYSPKNEKGVHWSDKKLNIKWPFGKKVISSKDKNNSLIKNLNFTSYKDLLNLK